jgi:hypothetical protein
MNVQEKPKPTARGGCEVDWCTCVTWRGGKKGMSGLEVCSCGHLPHVHRVEVLKS